MIGLFLSGVAAFLKMWCLAHNNLSVKISLTGHPLLSTHTLESICDLFIEAP